LRQHLPVFSARFGAQYQPAPPVGAPARMRSFRTSNAKLLGIGWAPQYPTPRQGLLQPA